MKLKTVKYIKLGQAQLEWETDERTVEPGLNEVIFRDFETCESLLTEYLFVGACGSQVMVGGFEWLVNSLETAARDEIISRKIETLETEVVQLESDLSKICDRQREFTEAPSASVDADVDTQDESSCDPQESATAHRAEKIRLESLRSQKYDELRSVRDRLAALRARDSSLSALDEERIVTRVIKVSCYNANSHAQGGIFRVSTRWKNVNFSPGFILTFPTASIGSDCTMTETLEIIQNTEIDWEDCIIEFEKFRKTTNCRRGIPSIHYRAQTNIFTNLTRTFNAYESKNCILGVTFQGTRWTSDDPTQKCKIYAAGKFMGEFMVQVSRVTPATAYQPYARFSVRDMMIDDTITVEDKADGSQQLTLGGDGPRVAHVLVYGMSSSSKPKSIVLWPLKPYTVPPPNPPEESPDNESLS